MELTRTIFWDADYDSINWAEKARYVIERVIMFGTLDDWKAIQKFYGREKILAEMLESRELDPKSLSFLSCIFDTPPEKFRCYTQIQSSRAHWNY
ncbi:MAG: hypothetical protein A2X22_02255 [Bacteroidetes bacterium GWF2_49_14]|nr:MAG: hypothetical protein A2X22_02255 [Bacteroidetes bacterium GWF2_49_14]HBB91819.1 hypothetical protein [Bacteroidales bacterium]